MFNRYLIIFSIIFLTLLSAMLNTVALNTSEVVNIITTWASVVIVVIYSYLAYLIFRCERDYIYVGLGISASFMVLAFLQTIFITLTIHPLSPSGFFILNMTEDNYLLLIQWWKMISTVGLTIGGVLVVKGMMSENECD